MSTVDSTNGSSNSSGISSDNPVAKNDFNDLDTGEFLKLLITELSNQDPLNPMDNTQLVQQISTIRDITATTKLSDTLDVVTNGQNLATATSMIGKRISALTDDGDSVDGVVDRVTVEVDSKDNSRTYMIQVGDQSVNLKNVREVFPDS